MTDTIRGSLQSPLQQRLVQLRRQVHARPELRFEEHHTAALLAEWLGANGFTVIEGVAGTGLVAEFDSGLPGPRILLRADMDALPVVDTTQTAWTSTNPGVCHACGHDVHMAVIMGAAESLVRSDRFRGVLTVLCQPAEEIPFGEASGAHSVLETGHLDKPFTAVLGLHCWPELDAGEVGIESRTAMAGKLAFAIQMRGQGSHVAAPQNGKDALLAASQVVLTVNTLLGREVAPGTPAALNIGTMRSGSTQSVIPDFAEVTGTIRTLDSDVQSRLRVAVDRVAHGIAAATGTIAFVEWRNEMPPLQNDEQLRDLARQVLPEVGVPVVELTKPPMTSDDFALLAERWPALYIKLGVRRPGAEHWPSLHQSDFDVDESCIQTGVNAIHAIAAAVIDRSDPS